MYKLLIADDEWRIRRGLRNALDWNELSIEVVGEAEDGEIALERIKKLQPDLIFLDICMPFLNGLELIEKLNNTLPHCIIIIITGHDEFKYIHEALKLKVFDYLLKPVQKDALLGAVRKAIEKISKDEESKVYLEWSSRQLDKNFEMLKQTFLNNWFKGTFTDKELLSELNFFKFQLPSTMGIIAIKVIQRLNQEVYSKDWDRESLNFAITNITLEIMQRFKPEITYIDENNNIIIISNASDISQWLYVGSEIETILYDHLHYTVLLEQKIIHGGISSVVNTYKEVVLNLNKATEYKPVVLLAIRYIDTHYYINDLSLGNIAEKFNVSSSYLSKLLKQETGLSFIDYLTRCRIKRAICMMDDPKLKIYEIAEAVGYSNQHYFSKAFKRIMGFAPIEYRGGAM